MVVVFDVVVCRFKQKEYEFAVHVWFNEFNNINKCALDNELDWKVICETISTCYDRSIDWMLPAGEVKSTVDIIRVHLQQQRGDFFFCC